MRVYSTIKKKKGGVGMRMKFLWAMRESKTFYMLPPFQKYILLNKNGQIIFFTYGINTGINKPTGLFHMRIIKPFQLQVQKIKAMKYFLKVNI